MSSDSLEVQAADCAERSRALLDLGSLTVSAQTMMSHAPADRLHGLDTLRTLAIALVMLYHAQSFLPETLQPIAAYGWMGVDLFFVLSGYLIAGQLLRAHVRTGTVPLRDFYRRRALRLLPAFFCVLLLYVAWPGWREAPAMSPLWQYITFTYNLFVDYPRNRAFSHVWSLCVEEQFYLVLPLILVFVLSRRLLHAALVMAGTVAILGVAYRTGAFLHVLNQLEPGTPEFATQYIEKIYYPTWSRMDGLLAGILVAALQLYRPALWSRLQRRSHWIALGSIGLIAICLRLFRDRFVSKDLISAAGVIVGYPLLATALAGVMMSMMGPGWLGHRRIPGSTAGATLAYSMYLTHKEVLHLCEAWLPEQFGEGTWRGLMIFVCASVLTATVLYGCVELPFWKIRDRRKRNHSLGVLRDPAI